MALLLEITMFQFQREENTNLLCFCNGREPLHKPTCSGHKGPRHLFLADCILANRYSGHLIFAQRVHIKNPSQKNSHLSFEQFNFILIAWPHCVRLFACSPWVSSSSSSSPLLSPTPASSWSDFLPYRQNVVNSYLIPPGWFVHWDVINWISADINVETNLGWRSKHW